MDERTDSRLKSETFSAIHRLLVLEIDLADWPLVAADERASISPNQSVCSLTHWASKRPFGLTSVVSTVPQSPAPAPPPRVVPYHNVNIEDIFKAYIPTYLVNISDLFSKARAPRKRDVQGEESIGQLTGVVEQHRSPECISSAVQVVTW